MNAGAFLTNIANAGCTAGVQEPVIDEELVAEMEELRKRVMELQVTPKPDAEPAISAALLPCNGCAALDSQQTLLGLAPQQSCGMHLTIAAYALRGTERHLFSFRPPVSLGRRRLLSCSI